MPEQLVSEYHKSRSLVVVTAILIICGEFGIKYEGKVPLIGMSLPEGNSISWGLGLTLCWGLIQLVIGWFQSSLERRQKTASKIDISLAFLIAFIAFWLLGSKLIPEFQSPSPSTLFVGFSVVCLGILIAALSSTMFWSLQFIRTKERAKQLALPRVPVSVRAIWRTNLVAFVLAIILLFVAMKINEPMSKIGCWLFCAPIVCFILVDILNCFSKNITLKDGTVISKKEQRMRIQKNFDWHDANYQIGGWDTAVSPDNTALYEAASCGDLDQMLGLLDSGDDPDFRNENGWTALHKATAEQHAEILKVLLEKGANPNTENTLGRYPLSYAARYGNCKLVRMLLKGGAKVDHANVRDPGPLFVAAEWGHLKVVEILLKAGASPRDTDIHGETAQENAQKAGHGEVASLLHRASLGCSE